MALENKRMPRLFIEHAATGIYFKVIQTGTLQTGDKVTVIYQDPSKLSVKSLVQAYFDKNFIDSRKIMQQASEIAALSDEWREKVLSRLK